jgi:hypothetical protein
MLQSSESKSLANESCGTGGCDTDIICESDALEWMLNFAEGFGLSKTREGRNSVFSYSPASAIPEKHVRNPDLL